MADFDSVYNTNIPNPYPGPVCDPPSCFVGSYPPVTPAGQVGPFFVNSYFLRPDRMRELGGPVPVRSNDIKKSGPC
jgi:hypothetical protein